MCKHEHRCSRVCGADMSFRDVTIKITDRGCDQGCEWCHALEAWAEIWEKSVSWVPAREEEGWLSRLVMARRICVLRAPHVSGVESWLYKSSLHRRIVSLSPYVEKPFNSKVIKSFVPELRNRKCFCVLGFLYYLYMDIMKVLRTGMNMSISRIHVWLCYMSDSKSIQVSRTLLSLMITKIIIIIIQIMIIIICRLCGDRDETINHIISECRRLTQKDYKTRHDWMGEMTYWELCKKFKSDHKNKWYLHNPESVQENEGKFFGILRYK